MKLTHYIYISAALATLTACSDDDIDRIYTVGEANNAIVLRAGVNEGGAGVQTRAGAEDNHAKHVAFTEGTKVALRIDGIWKGHDPVDIKQKTIATLDAPSGTDNKHNELTAYDPVRYWDDYGTADPANAGSGNGRETGLTIYGAAVNGMTSLPSSLNSLDDSSDKWKSLAWSVGTVTEGVIDQKTAGWGDYDLLTSNNVTSSTSDGTYKFGQRSSGKLLEFTHAMTKITVNLTAADGFPGFATNPATAKFENAPEVTLLGFNYTGNVDVEAKTSTPTASLIANFLAWRDNGAVWTAEGQHMSQLTAIVFPGNSFVDATNILKLEVDGNTFNVNATKINAANAETDNKFEQGKNYIFNIIVKKTDIIITATIKDWDDVNSEPDTPKISIDKTYGHESGTDFAKDFTLYRSTTITGSYLGTGDKADVTYVSAAGEPVVPAYYTMSPQLYWPTHSTHYFFRGVWPMVGSVDGSSVQLGPGAGQVKADAVDVANVAYKQGYYPSDLMIARPLITGETDTDEACKVHSGTQGICATTGDIRMNFRYMMSQIKVELTSSASTDPDYIVFDANTKVEIIGGYKEGAIKLSDCTSDFTGKTVANYTLHNKATEDYDSYHDAVIPQSLTDGMKFRITVKNSDESTDTYETVIKNIKVKEGSADPTLISAWASGKAYTYNLKITKTAIKVTATLTDWVPVEASDNVWF